MIGFESDRDPVPEKNRISQLDWITVRMGSQSDPIDLTKTLLISIWKNPILDDEELTVSTEALLSPAAQDDLNSYMKGEKACNRLISE